MAMTLLLIFTLICLALAALVKSLPQETPSPAVLAEQLKKAARDL